MGKKTRKGDSISTVAHFWFGVCVRRVCELGSDVIQSFIDDEIDFIDWSPDELEELSEDITVVELTEPQSEFIMCEAKFPLFVAGFGAGKSTTLGYSVLRDFRFQSDKPIKIGCYAPTYDLLKLITIPYLCEYLEASGVGYQLNKSDYIFYLKNDRKDQIICRSMDNPNRIVGYQTFRSHIDEIDTLDEKKAENAWNKIIARNRQSIYQYDEQGKVIQYLDEETGDIKNRTELNRVCAYSTPEGFRFCYKRWKKEKTPGYVMIKAPTYSNPHLPADYIQGLRDTYPAALIEAYIEGEFVNLTSGAVHGDFDRKLNHTDEEIRQDDVLEVGMDFNVRNMSATIGTIRNGKPMVLAEITKALDTHDICKIIKERYSGQTVTVFPDASGQNTSSKSWSESDLTIIRSYGFKIKKDKKNPFVKDRVISLNVQICDGNGERHLMVNTHKCPELTECLEQLVYDGNGAPDKKGGKDHLCDAIGYWIYQKWAVKNTKGSIGRVGLYSR